MPLVNVQGKFIVRGGGTIVNPLTGVFYVAKNGSNSNSGSIVDPFLTIQYAIDQIPVGTDHYTIYVASGDYTENITINRVNVHLVGMTDDSFQSKAISIIGNTLISASGSGSVVENIIAFNNLVLTNLSGLNYTVRSTGSGYALHFKNCTINQANSGFGTININNGTNDTRTYFNNTYVIANAATINALDFSRGTITEINDCSFSAIGGKAINITTSNAYLQLTKDSSFTSNSKTLSLLTNNQSTSNLCSFLDCTVNGVPSSSTSGIIEIGDGTQSSFSFFKCAINNTSTNATVGSYPFFEFNTAGVLFAVANVFSSLRTSAGSYVPFYAKTTAVPNSVVKYCTNVFASNKTSGSDTVTTPTAGVAGWAVVEKLQSP